jgi:hypothetical protein
MNINIYTKAWLYVVLTFGFTSIPEDYEKKKIECTVLGKVGLLDRGRMKEIITATPSNWLLDKLKNKGLM